MPPDAEFLARMEGFAAEPCKCHPNPQTMQEAEPCRACTAAGILNDFAEDAKRAFPELKS